MKPNALVCPGCGDEIDPRAKSRGMNTTEEGYCSLMCALETANSAEKADENGA